MKNVFELDDDELEDCFDGSSDVDMVREILQKSNVVDAESSLIDCENFANWFAHGVEGFIDEDEESEEWQEAWDNNYEWGMSIANNINDYLEEEDEE
jgi:hypothetical protein